MKTAQSIKSSTISPKQPRPSTRRKKPTSSSPADYILYALCALTAVSLLLNATAAVYFISYTRQLSSPLALDLPSTGAGLSPSSGWLPPSAEVVNSAEFTVTPSAPDLDTIESPAEASAPSTTTPQEPRVPR